MNLRNPRNTYDVAILGLGTMGSFAAWELTKRGARVIGFDRFHPPHDHGSHSGSTRVFRIAYPEGSGYSKLAQEAGDLWDQINLESDLPVLHRSGMLYMGDARDSFLAGILESARHNNLELTLFSADEVRTRYPAFQIPENYSGALDPRAGWINADAAIGYALRSARQAGAQLQMDSEVLGWRLSGSGSVEVRTANEIVSAGKLAITAGAWSASILRDLELPLTLRRKVLAWFDPIEPALFEEGKIPVFTFPEKAIYGFPSQTQRGVKMAEHLGGDDIAAPEEAQRTVEQSDLRSIVETASKYMPALAGPWPGSVVRLIGAKTCIYALTPDENFIVDLHPMHPNVVISAGFSGHGFKFAPLIAKVIADLALSGTTSTPIDFLRLARFCSTPL